MKRIALAAGLGILCVGAAARAQSPLTTQISGNTLTARIQLAGGVGADLTIVFEQVVGLNPAALALSAALVDPSDASLLSRLPDSALVSIPSALPVLVRIEPTATSTLSFSGVYKLSLYTHNLMLTTNSPLRVYRAPVGGAFGDMTGFLEMGSVRAGGSGPGFSEFLIVADLRPSDSVILAKFDSVQALLTGNASSITPAVLQDLQRRLDAARSAYAAGDLPAAINGVAGFGDRVRLQSGAKIPDVWRANSSDVNVAGLLRSAAETLKFSLSAKANGSP